jgi:hypothetical protein
MMSFKQRTVIFFALLTMAGCATMPTGPSVMVMPPPGKPFEVFQGEDATCRQWAQRQIGANPQEIANKNTASGAAVGTAVGAGLGAAIGAASGHAGAGALVGGASGLIVGTSAGAQAGQAYGGEAQRRYDNAYVQCMYSYGNQVPGYRTRYAAPAPPPPSATAPPTSGAVAPQQDTYPEDYAEEAPQFFYSPELDLYVAGGVPYDLVYAGGSYFYFYGGYWYRGPYYDGPWVRAHRRDFPPALLRYRPAQIRYYRDLEYRRFEGDRAHYDRSRMFRPGYRAGSWGRGRRERYR